MHLLPRLRAICVICVICVSCAAPAAPPDVLAAALPTSRPTAALTATPPLATFPPPTLPPPATPARVPSATPQPVIELLFTGDINPGRCVYFYSKQAGDLTLPYQPMAGLLQAADLTIGSLDAALSDVQPPVGCQETRNLLAPAEAVVGLQYASFDVLSVATNHVKDCGLVRGCKDESMLDTLQNLQAAGIQPVGAGRTLTEAVAPVVVEVQGVRFAFVAFTAIAPDTWAGPEQPGTAPFQRAVYEAAIQQARRQADVVIVLPHWGTEYSGRINWGQIYSAQHMVEAGAALIVGNHPHHVQGLETFPNGAVAAYSLGNFVFDQQWSDGRVFTLQGVVLRARFLGAQLQSVEAIPIRIHDNFQPRLAEPEERDFILQVMTDSLAAMPQR